MQSTLATPGARRGSGRLAIPQEETQPQTSARFAPAEPSPAALDSAVGTLAGTESAGTEYRNSGYRAGRDLHVKIETNESVIANSECVAREPLQAAELPLPVSQWSIDFVYSSRPAAFPPKTLTEGLLVRPLLSLRRAS